MPATESRVTITVVVALGLLSAGALPAAANRRTRVRQTVDAGRRVRTGVPLERRVPREKNHALRLIRVGRKRQALAASARAGSRIRNRPSAAARSCAHAATTIASAEPSPAATGPASAAPRAKEPTLRPAAVVNTWP